EERRVRLQPSAVTRRAETIAAVARQKDTHVHPIRPALKPAEPTPDAVEFAVPVDDSVPLRFTQRLPRHVGRNLFLAAARQQLAAFALRRFRAPRFDSAAGECLAWIGEHQIQVQIDDAAEAATAVARAERAVEGK